MLKDSIKLTGKLLIQKFNDKKELVYSTEVPNLVVTSGKEFIASRIVDSSTFDPMDYMAIGDDAQTGALSQTTLLNELARVTTTSASASGINVTFTGTFGAGVGPGSIVEAGIFNKDDSSVLIFDADTDVDDAANKITYTSHGLTTGDKITYTDGGGTAVVGLTDGGTYYVVRLDADNIKLATTYAFESAMYFFDKNKLWTICDQGVNDAAITALTKRINGGTNGLDHRKTLTNKYYTYVK